MMNGLSITADWEVLDTGTPEEKACFAAIGIRCGDAWLSEGYDAFVRRFRRAPLLSGYHLAQWLAWNWWRLRWEPRSASPEWNFSHHMATVGEGYVWPNVTVFSDGERIALVAKPSLERKETNFRYVSDIAVVVSGREFESAIDQFVEQMIGQLRAERVEQTNLDRLWQELSQERASPELQQRRKLEALLGSDPDEASAAALDRLVADSKELGEGPVNELAADHARGGKELSTASELEAVAAANGFGFSPRDVVRLKARGGIPRPQDAPAWKVGAEAARALREQEGLSDGPISNERLAKMVSLSASAITDRKHGPNLSFALDKKPSLGHIVLRSKWHTGRRFELARIIGDRVLNSGTGRLFPATRAYTYRQKAQRSFAAEFLSPFDAVDEELSGDYSLESQQDVAQKFQVSDYTVQTLLINHRRIERDDLEDEFDLTSRYSAAS